MDNWSEMKEKGRNRARLEKWSSSSLTGKMSRVTFVSLQGSEPFERGTGPFNYFTVLHGHVTWDSVSHTVCIP